jgi:hypothetical protein
MPIWICVPARHSSIKRRYTTTLFAEVFNLFNTKNFAIYDGNILSSGSETPETENRNRAAQFSFRLDY